MIANLEARPIKKQFLCLLYLILAFLYISPLITTPFAKFYSPRAFIMNITVNDSMIKHETPPLLELQMPSHYSTSV